MQPWRWATVGAPALVFCGWGNSSQAADILIEFESGAMSDATTTAIAISPSPPVSIAADAHLLSFAPPLVVPETGVPAIHNFPDETSPAAADAVEAAPLPPPPVPVPVGTGTSAKLPPPPLPPAVAHLFVGDADSLVARAVGSAEGTRTPDGKRTLAYYGHVDPGNRAWNQGTFSYQHGAGSPEEADQKQLERLKSQAQVLHRLASLKALNLTLEEVLNGIDLANQAPISALDRGYLDWLSDAKKMGLQGQEAIVWARTRSFLDPDTGRWNAPGLGNSVQTITQDQTRRQQAIAWAIAVNRPAVKAPNPPVQVRSHPAEVTKPMPANSPEINSEMPEAIDSILSMDLPDL